MLGEGLLFSIAMNPEHILWSTRGLDWGFSLVLVPKLKCQDWLRVRDAIFGGSSNDGDFFKRDSIGLCGSREEYAAVRFLDPKGRKDRAGRVIPHEFVIFGPSSNPFNDGATLKEAAWKQAESCYKEIFADRRELFSLGIEDGRIKRLPPAQSSDGPISPITGLRSCRMAALLLGAVAFIVALLLIIIIL
jgi:hypothetical protein